jgi:crotonobetainyl-CoA:carnitine CoA-transferase CaiB-like acyl-CoA transferase
VISCWDEEEWERFARAADKPEWLEDARFSSLERRKEHERELNELVAAWTMEQCARQLVSRLQRKGIHAAQVNSMRDLFTDPQIAFRNIWQKQEHTEMGEHSYRMVSYHLNETPGSIRRPAPCLGADNEEVFIEWLGMPRKQYEELWEQGVFS